LVVTISVGNRTSSVLVCASDRVELFQMTGGTLAGPAGFAAAAAAGFAGFDAGPAGRPAVCAGANDINSAKKQAPIEEEFSFMAKAWCLYGGPMPPLSQYDQSARRDEQFSRENDATL
jgi:hypothetical protein